MKERTHVLMLLFALWLTSCDDQDTAADVFLISSQKIDQLSINDISTYWGNNSAADVFIIYDVKYIEWSITRLMLPEIES
ncbi:MAG: hypothetical protein RIF33_12240 [Cyclobacteriaceae bacterium]